MIRWSIFLSKPSILRKVINLGVPLGYKVIAYSTTNLIPYYIENKISLPL